MVEVTDSAVVMMRAVNRESVGILHKGASHFYFGGFVTAVEQRCGDGDWSVVGDAGGKGHTGGGGDAGVRVGVC